MSDKEKVVETTKKQFYFKGAFWDKEAGKVLCRANEDGIYVATNKTIINKLKKAGVPEKPPVDEKGVLRFRNEGNYFKKKKKPKVVLPEGVVLSGGTEGTL